MNPSKKIAPFIAFIFLSLLLQGVAVANGLFDSTPSVHFPDKAADDNSGFRVVAEVDFGDGKVMFIDETFAGEFGFGILEQGNIDLGPLYELEASALEVFLAITPEGTEVPKELHQAHDLARSQNPSLATQARQLNATQGSALKSVSYHTFEIDTDNCWGWGGLGSYNSLVGNEPGTPGGHSSTDMRTDFRNWSSIPWVFSKTTNGTYYSHNAEISDQYHGTPFGQERAVAMCVTHAIVEPAESAWQCAVPDGIMENTVNYRVYLRVHQSGGGTWGAGPFYLNEYGEGVRYRSSSTASRRYTLEVVDLSKDSHICKEKYDAFWRSRVSGSSGPGGIGT